MNLWLRTLLVMLRARRRAPLQPRDVGKVRLRTLPTDLDLLRHMNNGRYLSLADLGRWDLLMRTGLFQAMRERGWYAVVASETVTFRKSLKLWQRFVLESRMVGHDDRNGIYMEHRFVVRGEVFATVLVRSRLLRRTGGTITHEELFAELGRPDGLPFMPPWVTAWAEASRLPSPKDPAPSVWEP